jgi:coproporphyrinogen III oxidase-like Fe-S oxidoreductase
METFDLLKNVAFDLQKFDLMIISLKQQDIVSWRNELARVLEHVVSRIS